MREDKIRKAREFAKLKHDGQLDDEGKSYFEAHLEQVVNIIRQVTNDEDVICAAYLHDTIEDTKTDIHEINIEFGQRITDLVMEVTHEGQKDEKGFYFPRLKTREAIMIKLADRLSNISRMGSWSKERQEHYLRKTKFWKSE